MSGTGNDIVVSCAEEGSGATVKGTSLVVGDYPSTGTATEVAPLHVHHRDDEAWYVVSGALRFRLADREVIASAGSTVMVPAGVAHTFGNTQTPGTGAIEDRTEDDHVTGIDQGLPVSRVASHDLALLVGHVEGERRTRSLEPEHERGHVTGVYGWSLCGDHPERRRR